jgi:hypothetical protein
MNLLSTSNATYYHPIFNRFPDRGLSRLEDSKGWYTICERDGFPEVSLEDGSLVSSGVPFEEAIKRVKDHYVRVVFGVILPPSMEYEVWERGINYDGGLYNLVDEPQRRESLAAIIGPEAPAKEEKVEERVEEKVEEKDLENALEFILRECDWEADPRIGEACRKALKIPFALMEPKEKPLPKVAIRCETSVERMGVKMSPQEKIIELAKIISDEKLRSTVDVILNNEKFFKYPASTHIHHAYTGGLAAHTGEVASIATSLCLIHPKADKGIVMAAALWHDFAKIWDYKLTVHFRSPDEDKPFGDLPRRYVLVEDHESYKKIYQADFEYKDRIHHVSGSMAEFTSAATNRGVDRKTIQAVQHAILAHHGRKDWGAVKDPQTLEAWILHTADYSSAHFGPKK